MENFEKITEKFNEMKKLLQESEFKEGNKHAIIIAMATPEGDRIMAQGAIFGSKNSSVALLLDLSRKVL